MRLLIALVLFCLFLVTNVEGRFLRLYPEEREIVYKYEAVVTTGTELPAPFISRFNLTGNIKVQSLKDHTGVQFISLKYSMYSGEDKSSKTAETVDFPTEAEALLEPFGIQYINGKISTFQISAEEVTWSKSVKQALAGVLQLDLFNINDINKQKAFISKEKSIYGECLVSYTVTPLKNGTKISKFHSGLDCPREEVAWSNIENINCPDFKSHQHDLISTSEKVYHVVAFDSNSLLIQNVVSEGQTFIFTNPNSGHTHSITVSQKLELQSVSESFEELEIKDAIELYALEYDSAEYYSFKFSTNENLDIIIKKVFQLLTVIVSQLQGPNQLLPEPNPQQAQLIPLLITYLRKLNDTHLENIFIELENKNVSSQMDIFLTILPLVGSKESSIFIVKLVSSDKLSNHVALFLLFSLPVNIRQTSEEILLELEDLINLPEKINSSVRNTAVLSFATLIYKMCGVDKCNPQLIEIYVQRYLKNIEENNHDFALQQTYITGLQNIRSQEIFEHFEPLIFGRKTFESNYLQEAALRAVSALFTKDPVKAYEVFWPVLSNRSESLQVRGTALMALLEGEVSNSTFLQLHRFMDSNGECPHLYNLYYSVVRGYAEDSSKCNFKKSESARQIIRITRKPTNSKISTSQIKCDLFGETVLLTIFGNPKTNYIDSGYISFTSTLSGYSINHYSVFFKLQGVDARSIKDIVKVFTSPSELHLLVPPKVTMSNPDSKSLHIELIFYNQGQAVATRFYNESNVNNLFAEVEVLITLKNNTKLSHQQTSTSYNLEKYFVTDIGIPGVFSVDNPSISSFEGKVNIESSSLNTSISIRQWSQGTTVLKVKNTIVNIWQGIIKSHISRFNLPFGFHINLDSNQGNVSFITSDTSDDDVSIGLKWYTDTNMFTVTYSDSYDALSQSCQTCKTTSAVTKEKTTNEVLTDISYESFAVSSSIYDCENDGSKELVKSAHDFYTRNVFSVFGEIMSSGYYLDNFLSKQAISGSCGYAAIFVPRNVRQQSVVPESVGATLQRFCDMLKDNVQHDASSSDRSMYTLLDAIKSKFNLVFNAEKNIYSLSVDSPSTNLALNSIPSGLNPDLISFLNKVINQYVMESDTSYIK